MSYIEDLIKREQMRQNENIELIASENFPSEAVMRATGSCLTAKYAEGYPTDRYTGNIGRYYGGCEIVDEIEEYTCKLFRELFKTDYHCNVQPHSGTSANLAVYRAVLSPGDTVLAMDLNCGGHLSHGSIVNDSGKLYNFIHYGVNTEGYIDFDEVESLAKRHHPKMIVCGASAYPRIIQFDKFHEIAQSVNAYLMADIAHIAGLIAAYQHPSPFGLADFVTTTTHKTLRGPRGGIIFCKPEYARIIDSAVFPGLQGGPLEHVIAAKGICAEEALTPGYQTYIKQTIFNSKWMAAEFHRLGYEVITKGTDNHLFLLNFTNTHPNITGLQVQQALDKHKITVNRNCVPNESRSLKITSGIRIGSPAMTTKGWDHEDFTKCARDIDAIIKEIPHG